MSTKQISATELARNLSTLLSEVRFRGLSLEVRRGKEAVARIEPIQGASGFPISRLNSLIAGLPRLGPAEADAFLADLERLDEDFHADEDPWAS